MKRKNPLFQQKGCLANKETANIIAAFNWKLNMSY
jgi:hypothetical protein